MYVTRKVDIVIVNAFWLCFALFADLPLALPFPIRPFPAQLLFAVAVTVTVTVLFIVCAHLSQLRQTEIVNCFAAAAAAAAAQVQDKQVTSCPVGNGEAAGETRTPFCFLVFIRLPLLSLFRCCC